MRPVAAPVLLLLPILSLVAVPVGGESLGISPAAFVADTVFVETTMSGSGGYRVAGNAGCEVAPIQLPHGAVLNTVTFWVRDDDSAAGHDVTVTVWEKRTSTNTASTIVLQGASSGSNPAIRAVIGLPPAGPHNVNTLTETFYVEACYGAAGLELHHLSISFTGPPAGIDTASPFVVPAASFRSLSGRPTEFDAQNGYVFASFLNGGFADDCLVAPVQLPEGVWITELTATLYDALADGSVGLELRRKRLNTSQVSQLVAEVATVGSSGVAQTLSTRNIAHPVFDDAWEYFLATPEPCPKTSSAHRIYSARVVYSSAFFADGFESGGLGAWSGSMSRGEALAVEAAATAATGPERLLLPAAAFLPGRTGSFYTPHAINVDQGRLSLSNTACSYAPVTLPDGATLSLLTAYLVDSDGSRALTVRLYAKNDNAAAASQVASVTSPGSTGPTAAFALLSGTVDTTSNHYYLEACGPAGAAASAFGVQSVIVDYFAP